MVVRAGPKWITLAGVLALACLPPASIETASEPALTPASTPPAATDTCRVLISERGDRGPLTHELVWDRERVRSTQSHPGMVVGTADELFAIWATRSPYDGLELYGVGEPDLRCEADVIWVRRLPHGAAQPLVEATPACVGTAAGTKISLESTLNLLSTIGPLVGWRARVGGLDPSLVDIVDYQTIDLRTFTRAAPSDWLLEPPKHIALPESERSGCEARDAPTSLDVARGFALTWHEAWAVRLRMGWACCDHESCELDESLPRPDPELAAMLPDADLLLHSPFGCGSIGLDGSVRTRDGALVGRHEVAPNELLGVVFLPSEHDFVLGWLDE